jgi:hypothetical protein
MWLSVIIIIAAAVLGLVWSYHNYSKLRQIPISSNIGIV